MSQVLRDAVDLLVTVVDKIDARLLELKAEEATLVENRAQLVLIIGERGAPATYRVTAVAVTAPPAASARKAKKLSDTGISDVDGAARIDAALQKADEPLRWPEVLKASKLSPWTAKRLVKELVAMGRVTRTGVTQSVRFSLPSGRAKRGAAAAPGGKGKSADDDGHGASVLDISAGEPAGVSDSSQDATHPAPSICRPPASAFAASKEVEKPEVVHLPPDDQFAKSLGKGSIAHGRETDDDDDEDAGGLESHEDEDMPADVDDLDLAEEPDDLDAAQADLDAAPARKRPGPKPKYKPGHRQLREHADRDAAAAQTTSWWMRPDANFAAEAERMRLDPKQPKTPGENNILCLKGAF